MNLKYLVAAGLVLPASAATASPCAGALAAFAVELNAAIEVAAAAGGTAAEGRAALLHHQPTPKSLAEAEARSGDGDRTLLASEAFGKAWDAEAEGNEALCQSLLSQARQALGR